MIIIRISSSLSDALVRVWIWAWQPGQVVVTIRCQNELGLKAI